MNHNNTDLSPSGNNLEVQDYQLDDSVWNLESIRQLALQQRLPRPRSLVWGIMLKTLPPPSDDLEESLKTHRNFYNDLKKKLSLDPRTVDGDDPLSQNDESAWNQHFCDNELKALILQDVVRTFPDELYFRGQEVQDLMVRVLFFWSRSHSHVGYRQGMHEILAPMLFELFCDRKYASSNISGLLKVYLDEDCLEHDSYMLFSALMKGLERFYTTGDIIPTSCGRMPSSKVVHNPNEVVRYLEQIKEEHLVPLDPELAEHLTSCNISLELFGIRWLRLLFGREFPRSEIAHLWGYLFSDGPSLPNIHYVVVAILISMRNTLLHPESGVVLSALMRPCALSVGHVVCLARHLARPLLCPRPPTPPPAHHQPELGARSVLYIHRVRRGPRGVPRAAPGAPAAVPAPAHAAARPPPARARREVSASGVRATLPPSLEESWVADDGSVSSEGVPEGGDVGTELATLAVLRAELPRAVAALAAALPPQYRGDKHLHTIIQVGACPL
ncbi:unnamed protein product [Plutella xylostella]|uniref:(diamondback moth) hypothetical protein n=1 Tax=Plutella xylostella TaxID=51655 RepID=A0A8S4G920_PLUXY|nr:unnamed protein product [Plutella xylostella]